MHSLKKLEEKNGKTHEKNIWKNRMILNYLAPDFLTNSAHQYGSKNSIFNCDPKSWYVKFGG